MAANQRNQVKLVEASFDPWLLWVAFRRNWYWTIPLGAIMSLIGGAVVYQNFVPWYRAAHILEANREFVIFQGVMQAPADLVQNERPLILNNLILGPVLGDSKICQAPSLKDPATRENNLRKNLSISDLGTKTLMQVSYRDTNPAAAAEVCNAVVKSYLSQRQRFDDRRISDLEGWLQPALKLWQSEMQDHQNRIITLSKNAKGFDPFNEVSQINADTGYLTSLREELSRIRSEEAVLEAELAMMKNNTSLTKPEPVQASNLPDDAVEALVVKNPEVVRITRLLEEKNSVMRSMSSRALDKARPSVYEELRKDAEALQFQLRNATTAAEKLAKAKLQTSMQKQMSSQGSASIASKEGQLMATKTKRGVFEKNYAEEEARLSKFAGETAELYFAQQNYQQASEVLKKLNDRVASLRTERQKSSTIETLSEAIAPSSPEEAVPWKKIGMVALGSFACPFGLALLWELSQKRVSSSTGLETGRDVPLLGEIAQLPGGLTNSRGRRVYEESIETVRANMMFSRHNSETRTIVVASSMSREGKSSLASHLSLSLARATDKPVLLIDADVRSPDQHHLFGIDMGQGLTSVLAGNCEIDQAIDRSLGSRLHILPAGKLESNPHRLISSHSVRKLLDNLKDQYEYIVIDTAPVLAAGETLCIAAEADATIVCVMRDRSKQDHLRRCLNRLEACGARVAGTIFGGVPTTQYSYRYGDYRYMKSGRSS